MIKPHGWHPFDDNAVRHLAVGERDAGSPVHTSVPGSVASLDAGDER